MMNQQPDKVFKDKLTGYSRPAPVNAWSKIEAGLEKKKHNSLWLKIAASLLLLAVAAFVLWPTTSNKQAIALRDKKTLAPSKKNAVQIQPTKKDTLTTLSQTSSAIAEIKNKPLKKLVTKTTIKKQSMAPLQTLIAKSNEPVAPSQVNEILDSISPAENITVGLHETPDDSSITSSLPKEEDNITLVFSAEETKDYINKNTLSQATSEEKKPSTLKKLLKKAADLKSNQDPFGDLRQMKNEILALNFKSEKQRGQNK